MVFWSFMIGSVAIMVVSVIVEVVVVSRRDRRLQRQQNKQAVPEAHSPGSA